MLKKDLEANLFVCPSCNKHHRIKPYQRFDFLFGKNNYEIMDTPQPVEDPLGFVDSVSYKERLKSARKQWNCIARILKKEGANPTCMARFYLAIVQAVLLYGADTWVVSERNMDRLKSFHWRAARYMTGEHIRKVREDSWEYPDHEKLLIKCKLLSIETYIERRRGTLRDYIKSNRNELLQQAQKLWKHSRDVNKLFWCNQKYLNKAEMKLVEKDLFN